MTLSFVDYRVITEDFDLCFPPDLLLPYQHSLEDTPLCPSHPSYGLFFERQYFHWFGDIVFPAPPVLLVLILLVFAVFPAIYPTPKFFKKRGFENVIIEYRHLKKILYISIAILGALLISYYYLTFYLYYSGFKRTFDWTTEQGRFEILLADMRLNINILLFMIPIVPVSIIIKLLLEHARKEFRLYYAKGCFKIVSKKDTHELDKLVYFKIGLIWYNKFLKKNINLHINDILKIYSKIITHSPLDENKALTSISESFDSEDCLKPLRYLSAFIPDTEAGHVLTRDSITATIKGSSDLLIPIITIIITIITTFILPAVPIPNHNIKVH